MLAKLIVEGLEFPIEIQDPELQKLLMPQKKTGYERVGDGHTYSFVNSWNDVLTMDDNGQDDDLRYETANYYSDRTIAENNARADALMRQLRRFAVENREQKVDWENDYQLKYSIYYDYTSKTLGIDSDSIYNSYGIVYFDSETITKQAIDIFHDELIWYFTEYKNSL